MIAEITKHIKEGIDFMWEHPSHKKIQKLKEKYKDLYPQVESLVNEWDPVGLIEGGAPKDEYDCISVQLIELLVQGKSSDEIYEFVMRELEDHFELGIKSIGEEFKEKFIQKQINFSEEISAWYLEKNNKN